MILSRFSRSLSRSRETGHISSWLRSVCQNNAQACIDVHPTVSHALGFGKPIVALESTIITHGMPWPQNLETALEVEEIVRENGATPATIAIINGRIKVGLAASELKTLASMKSDEVIKCSRRDLPFLVSHGRTGGTTVAATMLISHMVGLKIFATGGIGGVHQQGHITMDISADLIEFGRTPIAVVCSGVKSILDIQRTLEFLETQGVCIATYGSPECCFPDFYTTDSGYRVNYNLQTPTEAANLIRSLFKLGMNSGILIGVPIPEEHAADKESIRTAIAQAQDAANAQNLSGKDVTPFLLAAIAKKTGGSSLKANIALIKNNAATAARIAQELYRKTISIQHQKIKSVPVVIGASILDLSFAMLEDMPEKLDGATYRTLAKQGAGGVGRNIADGLFKLYGATNFISSVGKDHLGETLLKLMPPPLHANIQIDDTNSTSLCSVICDKTGDCKIVLGNMEIHDNIKPEHIEAHEELLSRTPLIIMDSNLSLSAIKCVLQLAQKHGKPVFFEPTDMRIGNKPFKLDRELTSQIRFISPNIHELKAIVEAITQKPVEWNSEACQTSEELIKATRNMLQLIAHNFDCVLVTLGEHGVVISKRGTEDMPFFDSETGEYLLFQPKFAGIKHHCLSFFPAEPVDGIVNVSGAGDSFSSGLIAGMLRGYTIEKCIAFGFLAARRSLQTITAVPRQYFNDDEEEERLLEETYRNLKKQNILQITE